VEEEGERRERLWRRETQKTTCVLIFATQEHCNGELEEFQRQLPGEKKHTAARYKLAKEEYTQAASAAQAACVGALRGMLGSTFPIIRNRYQIGTNREEERRGWQSVLEMEKGILIFSPFFLSFSLSLFFP